MSNNQMDIDGGASASPQTNDAPTTRPPQALTAPRLEGANHFGPRRIASSATPRAARHYYRPAYHCLEDDPRYNPSHSLGAAALDYDEQPALAEDSRAVRSKPRFHRAQRPVVYEEPVAKPEEPPFRGYDDDVVLQELRFIWDRLQSASLPRHIATSWRSRCLISYEGEEFQEHQWKKDHIDLGRERSEWYPSQRIKIALRTFEKLLHPSADNRSHCEEQDRRGKDQGRDTSYWDELKRRNGVNLEDDSYTGIGPKREVAERIARFNLSNAARVDSGIEDSDMDESPYNDRRRDGRRGGRHSYGGGGGGGGGRKRGREDDDDQRDHRRQQRPRYEEPIASRLRRDIIFIGEEGSLVGDLGAQNQAAGFGRDIANNFEDDQVRGPLLDTLVDMLCEQPLKLPFLAAVALYANDLNAEVGREFIARASKKMIKSLELGEWRDFKLLLRFHACLQGVLEGLGVFQILNQLFDWVIDLQSASAEDALGLELIKIILLTIPYAIAATPDAKNALGDILDRTEIVASEAPNHPLAMLVDPYPTDGEEKPFGYQSVVEMLQKQLREEASRDWELKCIPRVYSSAKKPAAAEGENGVKTETAKHALPALTVPVPVDITKKPLFPETFFTMFAGQDIQTVPSMNDISLSLIRDAMVDTISIMHYNRIAAASFLTAVDQFWAPGTFATRGITLDQLRNYPSNRSTWKPEDMFIDAVFSQLLVLPEAKQKLIYYHSIVFEACKHAPTAVAPTLGRGIRWIFRHIDDMDLELFYRYLDWFAHHLSNFEFRWKWTEWIDELERSDLTPKKAFIVAAVDKEVRLSFAKRIRDTLPEAYYSILTEGKFKDIPAFKYDKEDTPFSSEGKEICALMKRKAPEEQIEPYIEAIQEQAANHSLDPVLASTDVYVTAMCQNGAKSVSHITAAIDRSKDRLQKARQQSPGVGRQIVHSVVSYWKDQPGNAVNIVDKLLNYTIVTPESVIEWALGPEGLGTGAVLAQAWRYEIVSKTMTKVTTRVQQIVQAKVNLEVQAANAEENEAVKQQIQQMDDLLASERHAMRQLFATIEDAVAGVASGAASGLAESSTSIDDADVDLVKSWGAKWARVFRRKLAVEEAHVGEQAVEILLVSAKEQDKLARERAAREAEEDAAARAKEEEERAKRIAQEEAERKVKEEADAVMDDGGEVNGNGEAEDLDVAE